MTPRHLDLCALDPTTSAEEVGRLIHEALRRPDVAHVVVPPVDAKQAVERLRTSVIGVIGVVGYPLGLNKPTVKAIEAVSLVKDGVAAIEVTPHAAAIAAGDFAALKHELLEVARGARAARSNVRIEVRIGLDCLPQVEATITDVATAIVHGACDAIVLDGTCAPRTIDLVRRLHVWNPAMPVRAWAAEAGDVATLLDVGAARVTRRLPR